MSVIESEDYDAFVTSTIVHDVDKCTRSRLCGAARLNFDDVFPNARLKFKYQLFASNKSIMECLSSTGYFQNQPSVSIFSRCREYLVVRPDNTAVH